MSMPTIQSQRSGRKNKFLPLFGIACLALLTACPGKQPPVVMVQYDQLPFQVPQQLLESRPVQDRPTGPLNSDLLDWGLANRAAVQDSNTDKARLRELIEQYNAIITKKAAPQK